MRLMPILPLLAILTCTTEAPEVTSRVPPVVGDAAEEAIRAALTTWVAANNRGDLEAANQIWAADVVGWFPQHAAFTPAAGAELVGASSPEGRSTYDLTINEVLVSGDLAVVRDTWRETMHFKGGATAVRTIRSFEVWKRQHDGEWRITRWISAPEAWERSAG